MEMNWTQQQKDNEERQMIIEEETKLNLQKLDFEELGVEIL